MIKRYSDKYISYIFNISKDSYIGTVDSKNIGTYHKHLESCDKGRAHGTACDRKSRQGRLHTQERHTSLLPVKLLPHEYNSNNSMVV